MVGSALAGSTFQRYNSFIILNLQEKVVKKFKKSFLSLLLAVFLVFSLVAVPASAKSINVQPQDIVNLTKVDTWIFTHPTEAIKLVQRIADGDYSAVDDYIPDPETREFFKRAMYYSSTVAYVQKTAIMTVSPQNAERNLIPSVLVKGSDSTSQKAISKAPFTSNFNILTIRDDSRGKVNINIFLIYKDTHNNLEAVGILRNESGQKLQIDGIHAVQLTSNGKEIAGGNPSKFATPIQLSPHVAELNNGFHDGLPTMCFIKMTFAPGTYDDSIDISNLDNVGCIFSLDYSVIQ